MKPGSVIVDLAAEAGGNCAVTQPGKLVTHQEVKVIGMSPSPPLPSLIAKLTVSGYTDLPSRLPTQSSTLYSNNITKLLLSMAPREKEFGVDLSDEVVRGLVVTHNGEILPPAPRPAPPPPPAAKPEAEKEPEVVALTPLQKTTRETGVVTAGMASVLALGEFTSPLLMSNAFTFALASLIGYRVVCGVYARAALAAHECDERYFRWVTGFLTMYPVGGSMFGVCGALTIYRHGWCRRHVHSWRRVPPTDAAAGLRCAVRPSCFR